MPSRKILPLLKRKNQVLTASRRSATTTSHHATSVSTRRAESTAGAVKGKSESICIASVSGFLKAKTAKITETKGVISSDPFAEVFGAVMVAEMAAKIVFHRKNPPRPSKSSDSPIAGFDTCTGIVHPEPKACETSTKSRMLAVFVSVEASV